MSVIMGETNKSVKYRPGEGRQSPQRVSAGGTRMLSVLTHAFNV